MINYKFIFTLIISLLFSAAAHADLYYNTYAGTGAYPSTPFYGTGTLYYPTVLSTGTVTSINHNWGSGNILNSGLSERVIVKYWGLIYVPGTGYSQTLTFYNYSDDGFYLKINNTVVIDDWQEQGGTLYNGSGSITLAGGQYYNIEVWYYENSGDAAAGLYWIQTAGSCWPFCWLNSVVIVPTSAFYLPEPDPIVYVSNITLAQQTRVNAFTSANILKPTIYIEQIGDNNTITITQKGAYNKIGGVGQTAALIDGDDNTITIRQGNATAAALKNQIDLRVIGDDNTLNINQGITTNGTNINSTNGHYQLVDIAGNLNIITTQQTNVGGVGGHYMETTVIGNSNTILNTQVDNGNKIMFAIINGNNNTITANQTSTGQHYLDLTLTGNGHTATVTQTGTEQHKATVELINNGGAINFNLTQNSNTGQIYNVTQACTNVNGCSLTVNQ